MEEMKRDWRTFGVRPERFVDAGDDRVLVLGWWRAQGRKGEDLLDFRQAAWPVRYRKGKLVQLRTFTERERPSKPPGCGSRPTSEELKPRVRSTIRSGSSQ